ncbi:transmembrane protein 209-like [Eudromia elegans]
MRMGPRAPQSVGETDVLSLQRTMAAGGISAGALLDESQKLRREARERKVLWAWGLLNISVAGMICTHVYVDCGSDSITPGRLLSTFCNIPFWPLWYIDVALASLLTLNAAVDFWFYFKNMLAPANLIMTLRQWMLLGMQNAAVPVAPMHDLSAQEVHSRPSMQGQNVLSYSPGRPLRSSASSALGDVPGCGLQAQDVSSSSASSSSALSSSPSGSGSQQAQVLRKFQYQPAWSPFGHRDEGRVDFPEVAKEVWARVLVNRWQLDHVDSWMDRFRSWISETILVPLVREMDSVSAQLRRMGYPKLPIGGRMTLLESWTQVTQWLFFHAQCFRGPARKAALAQAAAIQRTLHAIMQYLDVAANQEYVVARIRELAQGGLLSAFHWDRGGDFRGRPWAADLPTDCAILMHLLCTYLDSRLPATIRYPQGKTFTCQHFVQAPAKPDLTNQDMFCIYQSSINPPHYQLLYRGHVYNLEEL